MPVWDEKSTTTSEGKAVGAQREPAQATQGGDMAFQRGLQCDAAGEDPEANGVTLRMAADMMAGGYWWTGQTAPVSYAVPLEMLSECVGVRAEVFGEEAISLFTSAIRCLDAATQGVDETWVSEHYSAEVVFWRSELERRAARMQVEDVQDAKEGGSDDPATTALALQLRLDELTEGFQSVEDFLTARNASLGRKLASKMDWPGLFGDKVLLDPETGKSLVIGTGTAVADYVARAKPVLKLLTVSGNTAVDSETTAGQVADVAGILKNVVQGTTSLAAVICEGYAWVLRLEASTTTDVGQAALHTQMAGQCVAVSRAIATSKTLTGALAALDLVRHVATLADPDASVDKKVEAAFGAATATANLGSSVASGVARSGMVSEGTGAAAGSIAGFCTAMAVAIPVGWLVGKASLWGLRETQVAVGASLMVEDFETLIAAGDSAYRAFDAVTTSQFLAGEASDPERARALREVACEHAERVSQMLSSLPGESAFRWTVLREQLRRGLEHPGATGTCSEPDLVAEAVTAVNSHISWCLEHAQELIYEELDIGPGVERDRPDATAPGGLLGVSPEPS